MANIASAKKRARQGVKRTLHNKSQRSMMRRYMKRVINAIAKGDRDEARQAYQEAVPVIDRMSNKGIIHKNKAARHKSRLNAQIQGLG